ncbi:SDR family NAD(P)-dependent oxidoreductase [Hyphomicrobium sp.]|uniref:SDR family NAD(P)-dependent oxidoreductase n=1 Tax=Hyphomicrobium sp. TaxID=82 RepID=UPI002CEEB014|nr:SDR family NAD(P)-dependent oxidoreductase [Hyphomicrobium sp.]HVZ04721.1 SDR family NAD(P)-dependent oxidoreductase [Hyphomicrobium sp.]
MARALDRKTALVTGANRGIGFEIARQLAARGIFLLAGVRSEAKAHAAKAAFGKLGLDIEPVVLDVADAKSIPNVLRDIEGRHGPIDIAVNNAAIMIDGPGGFSSTIRELTDDTFRRTWETNVFAPMAIIRTLLPGMIDRGYGRIVNVSSRAGQLSGMSAGFPAYRVSKSALNALTAIAAAEADAAKKDVKINACSPGWVRTDMGGPDAPRSPEQGAETAVWLATLPSSGPNGGFFEDKKVLSW